MAYFAHGEVWKGVDLVDTVAKHAYGTQVFIFNFWPNLKDGLQPHGYNRILEIPHIHLCSKKWRKERKGKNKSLMPIESVLLLKIFLEALSSDFCIPLLGFS